jgi:hypothetical protein
MMQSGQKLQRTTGQPMNEDQLSRLRNRLDRWRERLLTAETAFFVPKLRRLWHFLLNEPLLSPILEDLARNQTAAATADHAFAHANLDEASYIKGLGYLHERINELITSDSLAAFTYNLLLGAFRKHWDLWKVNHRTWVGYKGSTVGGYEVFKAEVLVPFFDYLDDRLDEQQALLGLLVRYKHRSEWFNRQALLTTAQNEEARKGIDKKRAEVEKVLKEDLYRYPHDQGIDFTIEPPCTCLPLP